MKSTGELENEIRKSATAKLLEEEEFEAPDVSGYLSGLLHRCGLTVQEVVLRCNLDRSYAYQMFNGVRRPTRGFLLKLALVLRLDEEETQRLLKLAGQQPLYVRNRRDAAVFYAIAHRLTVEKTEALLSELGEEGLS